MSKEIFCLLTHPEAPNFFIRGNLTNNNLIKDLFSNKEDKYKIYVDKEKFDELIISFNLLEEERKKYFLETCEDLEKDYNNLTENEIIEIESYFNKDSIVNDTGMRRGMNLTVSYNGKIYVIYCIKFLKEAKK